MKKQTYKQFISQQNNRRNLCAKYAISMRVFRGQTYDKAWEAYKAEQRKISAMTQDTNKKKS